MKVFYSNKAQWFLCATVFLSMIAVEVCAAVVNDSFGEYDVILQRKPFGEYIPKIPDSAKKNAALEPTQAAFMKYIKMSAITDSVLGIRVGLLNKKEKPSKSYFLYIGDSIDGIELVDADYQEGWALLRVGGEEEVVRLEDAKNFVTEKKVQPRKKYTSRRSSKRGISRPPSKTPKAPPSPATKLTLPDSVTKRLSYAERRKIKHEKDAKKDKMIEEMARRYNAGEGKGVRAAAEDTNKRLQKLKMDLIRQGKTSEHMPILLTPEMDAELVKEGFLPPSK